MFPDLKKTDPKRSGLDSNASKAGRKVSSMFDAMVVSLTKFKRPCSSFERTTFQDAMKKNKKTFEEKKNSVPRKAPQTFGAFRIATARSTNSSSENTRMLFCIRHRVTFLKHSESLYSTLKSFRGQKNRVPLIDQKQETGPRYVWVLLAQRRCGFIQSRNKASTDMDRKAIGSQ